MTLAGPAAADTTTTLNAVTQGESALNGTSAANGNYFTTNNSSTFTTHGFASFDLSTLSGQITGATLTLPNTSCGATSTAGAGSTLSVWDVTTPAASVVPGPSNPALYNDLGTGTNYGSTTLTAAAPAQVVVSFNSAGLADLAAAQGNSAFFVGFSLAATGSQLLFGASTLAKGCIPTLTITLADVVSTPMLNGWVTGGLVAVALLAFAVVLRRRRFASARA